MNLRFGRLLMPVAVLIALADGAAAHHSFSMFDAEKTITLSGTVKEWQWTNPHAWLILTVTDDKGEVHEWGLEGQSPQVLRGQGYTRTTMKAGDKVSVVINPRRDGSHGGALVSGTDAAGQPLNKLP